MLHLLEVLVLSKVKWLVALIGSHPSGSYQHAASVGSPCIVKGKVANCFD